MQPCLPPGFEYLRVVSAAEIIEQIKALPPNEKAAVVDFVHQMESGKPEGVQYVDPKDLGSTAEKVFDRYDDLFRKLAQ